MDLLWQLHTQTKPCLHKMWQLTLILLGIIKFQIYWNHAYCILKKCQFVWHCIILNCCIHLPYVKSKTGLKLVHGFWLPLRWLRENLYHIWVGSPQYLLNKDTLNRLQIFYRGWRWTLSLKKLRETESWKYRTMKTISDITVDRGRKKVGDHSIIQQKIS